MWLCACVTKRKIYLNILLKKSQWGYVSSTLCKACTSIKFNTYTNTHATDIEINISQVSLVLYFLSSSCTTLIAATTIITCDELTLIFDNWSGTKTLIIINIFWIIKLLVLTLISYITMIFIIILLTSWFDVNIIIF